MRYKAEAWFDNIVVYQNQYRGYSSPKQVVRNVANSLKGKFDHYLVYVANEHGLVWVYRVKKVNGKYEVKLLKTDNIYSVELLEFVFTNNTSIRGIC